MLNSIYIDSYEKNSYHPNHVNCSDLVIAYATGYQNFHNFYYYLFYKCININWSTDDIQWLELTSKALNMLGLEMKTNIVDNKNDFFDLIKSKIDAKQLVILPTTYKDVYHIPELRNSPSLHLLILSGYDQQRHAFQIRDYVRDFSISLGLYPMFIQEDWLKDIWTKAGITLKEKGYELSNLFSKQGKNEVNDVFYTLEYIKKPAIDNYEFLITEFVNHYHPNNCKLLDCIKNDQYYADIINKGIDISPYLLRELCRLIAVIFDSLEKYIGIAKNKKETWNLRIFKEEYLSFREQTVMTIHKNILKSNELTSEQKQGIIEDIISMDERLFAVAERCLNFSPQK